MAVGIAICLAIWFMPVQSGLPVAGQHCLALSLLAVVWLAFGVVYPGYMSLILLVAWVLTRTLMYLVIGRYLIAAAVDGSGR